MKKCDVVITVDVFNDSERFISDRVEYSYDVKDDYDCTDSIDMLLENLIDAKEIEVDNRYIIIAKLEQEETYDMEYGIEYDEYLDVIEIFLIDTDICKKYYINECEEDLKSDGIKLVNPFSQEGWIE